MENKNDKIQNFFSEQLRELKATYSNKIWGKVYTATDKEKALERCLELADFDICLDDIQADTIICKCNQEKFAYVVIDPQTKFFFVVSVCNCEQKGGNEK
jgi:CheY-like chemotaxis protein